MFKMTAKMKSYEDVAQTEFEELLEPAAVYLLQSEQTPKIDALGDFFTDTFAVMQVIKEGISQELFRIIQAWVPFSEESWAGLLGISTKSLQRYAKSKSTFKRLQSEKIIEVAEVAYLGLDIFGDRERFWLWLDTPSFAFAGRKPQELLSDSYGKEMLLSTLVRMDHGIFI